MKSKIKKSMIIIIAIVSLLIIVFIAGSINLSSRFHQQVKTLFSLSENISANAFSYTQLEGLPAPVQRYFKHVLKEGQPYISYISLKHDGQFKTGLDKDWIDIKGEQYFTAQKPGFIWKGATAMFTARDMYIADQGRLVVLLFNVFKVADGKGENFNEGELQRWLGENVWFPTNLLPGEHISWTAINDSVAQLSFNYKGIAFAYRVNFNGAGEIASMETTRFMEKGVRETWIITLNEYKVFSGVLVPTVCEVLWRLKKGDYRYAKFHVKEIVYDVPKVL
jgi:hypothetical protein